MESFLLELVFKYPKAAGILSLMYLVSLLNKAIFTALRKYVTETATKTDDQALDKVESHKAYKAIVYALDLVARIKLPLKK